MKVLLTGGSGFLGQYLNKSLSKEFELLTLYNNNIGNCGEFNSMKVNIGDFEEITDIFVKFKPNVVIHTAGFSRPETCDAYPEELVWKVNVNATAHISSLCADSGAKLIYTSTDLVYDGNKGGMLKEDALLNPVSLYAKSKIAAEKEISRIFDNYIILRTALLIGLGLNHSSNNFDLMYKNFKSGKTSRLFYDQFRTPLSVIRASEIICEMCKSDIKSEIINFGGSERVSRVKIGEMVCEIEGFDKSLINRASMNDVPSLHKVADVSLDTEKLHSYGFSRATLLESIKEILRYSG